MAWSLAGAMEGSRPRAPLSGIFYQPRQQDLYLTPADWAQRMALLHRDGLDTMYIQWLRYGETDFLRARLATGEPFIQTILDSAQAQGVGIHIGLFAAPDFFHSLGLSPSELESYLFKLREKSLQTARAFYTRYGGHPAFCGWYLPEEIDDLHWKSSIRATRLQSHLDHLNRGLKRLNPHKPIAISSFFTGASAPETYAGLCQTLLEDGNQRLLVQDGLGTGRMGMAATQHYHNVLSRITRNKRRLHWVVELFEDDLPGPGFSGKAVHPEQLHERLAIIHDDFKGNRLVAFSLRYYLDKNARLSSHYHTRFHKPGDKDQDPGPIPTPSD